MLVDTLLVTSFDFVGTDPGTEEGRPVQARPSTLLGGGKGSYVGDGLADADGDACVPPPEPPPEAGGGGRLVTGRLFARGPAGRAPRPFHWAEPENHST